MTATGKNTPYEVTSTKLIGGKRLYYVKQGFNEWTGYSVKEALAKRENDINAFLDQRSDSAICLRVAPDEYMIGYLTIGGWMVRFVHGQSKADHNGEILSLNGHIAGKDRRECERSMRCHAAHLDIKFGPYDQGTEIICDGQRFLRSNTCTDEDRREQALYVAWQRGCAIGKARGLDDHDMRKLGDAEREAERKRIDGLSFAWTERY
jgi:hypothetical protein